MCCWSVVLPVMEANRTLAAVVELQDRIEARGPGQMYPDEAVERLHARLQGVATLLFSIFLILAAIGLILAAIVKLVVMVALFLAFPFGTIAYLIAYGFFNRPVAIAALGWLMMLKLGFAICLALAQQRFLQNRGLVLMIITSFLGNIVVSFLHGIVPGFLVSITDAIAAIVVGILAALWAIVFLVGSLISVVKALRLDRV